MSKLKEIYWRATFYSSEYPDMQITIEFKAPEYQKGIDFDVEAKLAFVKQIQQSELIKVKDVEPIERR